MDGVGVLLDYNSKDGDFARLKYETWSNCMVVVNAHPYSSSCGVKSGLYGDTELIIGQGSAPQPREEAHGV